MAEVSNAAPVVSAKTLHPETQVVTANVHNSIVAKAEAWIASLEADLKTSYTKYHVIAAAVGALVVGIVVGAVL